MKVSLPPSSIVRLLVALLPLYAIRTEFPCCEAKSATNGITSVLVNQKHQTTIPHGKNKEPTTMERTILKDNVELMPLKKNAMWISQRSGARATTNTPAWILDARHRLKIGFYFALWYALNVAYNIENKKLLNIIPAPLSVATIQFFIGAIYIGLLWLLRIRPTPKLTIHGAEELAKVGFYHSAGQLSTMISMNVGPISFTHIVKALEPFFSAIVSALVFGEWMKPQVYATLLPVVGGVGYACLQEKHFSWLSFVMAMSSNLAFALRAVCSKRAMSPLSGKNLSSTNLFGVVTWFAAFMSMPVALLLEGTSFFSLWNKAVLNSGKTVRQLMEALLLSGIVHYLNNEVMYLALSNVHPVTLAVGNTMKRVFILVASVLVFQNPISLQAAIGSAVGIGGVLLYSLTKEHYEKMNKSVGNTA